MARWWARTLPFHGGALFPDALPPAIEEAEQRLVRVGVTVRSRSATSGHGWSMTLEHPAWGHAELEALHEFSPPDDVVISHAHHVTEAEKSDLRRARSTIMLRTPGSAGSVLRERKLGLRFLHALLGPAGIATVDADAQRFWSRTALEEELAHDAELDVEAIYTLHSVQPDGGGPSFWLHSHGLAEAGGFDYDILAPTEAIVTSGADFHRALAFAILEEKVEASTSSFQLISPGPPLAFVAVAEFTRKAAQRYAHDMRDAQDPGHNGRRAVLCDPPRGGLLRWFRKEVQPSSFLSGRLPEDPLIMFSTAATELMQARARGTIDVLRRISRELTEFKPVLTVKLGYVVDGGAADDREHLWFQVHRLKRTTIEATLLNTPYHIARMKEGDRAEHSLELLSDWTLFTPAGPVNPRSLHAARALREHPEEARRVVREAPPPPDAAFTVEDA